MISPIASFVSLPEIFDDNDIIVLSFTSTSCEGQEDDSQFILSSSEETNARDFILPRLSSVINSQESVRPPDTQITAEFSITSSEFNIPSSQWVPATNSSQHTISDPVSDIVLDQDEDISLLDIPDYEEFTNVELKSKLKAYGYKAGHNRNQMIKDLRTIYTSIHSSRNSSRSSTPTNNKPTTTTTNFSPDLLMAPVIEDITFDLTTQSPSSQEANSHKTIDPTVKESIIRHLKSKTNIWQKILTFSVSKENKEKVHLGIINNYYIASDH